MARLLHITILLTLYTAILGITPRAQATARSHAFVNSAKRQLIYGDGFRPQRYVGSARWLAGRQYVIRPQGNTSNCDYLAVYHGVQNTGGDGQLAYNLTRALVPQRPRDFKESFYTLRGPNGSDLPFSLNNLGAAPEAFVGVYEALGYNAVLLATQPGTANLEFVRAIRDRLAEQPERSFAHLWITPRNYGAPRRLRIEETGESVDLIYPYHEVTAMLDPVQPERLVILDGIVGYPFTLPLATIAQQVRGFSRAFVVSAGQGSLVEHQRFQAAQQGRPFVTPTLGGAFLYTARQLWGPSYATWGQVIGAPFRVDAGSETRVVLPGAYVHYERVNANDAGLASLGLRMGFELEQAGVLPPNTIQAQGDHRLINAAHSWAIEQFGSVERFTAAFGRPLTGELWIGQEAMRQHVLRGVYFPPVTESSQPGYVAVFTERALLIWDAQHGVSLIPLGWIYYQ
ncbi:MAG TPA: hypothetical protein VGD69_07880 [Herpetosiphonaceae bacterium]